MRVVVVVVGLSALIAGCGERRDVECVEDSNCNRAPGGLCTLYVPTGNRWCTYVDETGECPSGRRWSSLDVGDGLSGTCVEPLVDAGRDASGPDGPAADATVDAEVADAMPDADTANPVVATYQAADLVVGQPGFTSETDQGCVANAAAAESVSVDNGVLYVRENARYRALAFVPLPMTDNPAAARPIGQSVLTSCAAPSSVTSSNLGTSGYVAAGGGVLVVSDPSRNRVLIWNPAPSMGGQAASVVLGQPNMTSSGFGNGANQLTGPNGVWTDGTRVVVADPLNNRVLVWTSFPTVSGEPADLVLGQLSFNTGSTPSAPSASRLRSPRGVWSDGVRLVVADSGHHRVLVWNTFPTANGQPADVVLGQPSFTASGSGLSATAMSSPHDVSANADALFVADFQNDRVLVFAPFPTASGSAAAYVLGQPDFDTGANNPAPTAQSLNGPRSVHAEASRLWVADTLHKRALRFSLYGP